jgi:hypothetical protein
VKTGGGTSEARQTGEAGPLPRRVSVLFCYKFQDVAIWLGEHKLCKTPANQCILTLLPFDLILGRTSLELQSIPKPPGSRATRSFTFQEITKTTPT